MIFASHVNGQNVFAHQCTFLFTIALILLAVGKIKNQYIFSIFQLHEIDISNFNLQNNSLTLCALYECP